MATNALEVIEYNRGLKNKILQLFRAKIVPANFVMLIPKYGINVLTDSDIARIRKNMDHKIDEDVNLDLLDLMTKYDGWFDCLIKCLGDFELKQSYLIPLFEKLKSDFDAENNGPNRDPNTTEPKLLDEPNGEEIESDFVLTLNREKDTAGVGVLVSGAVAGVGVVVSGAVVEPNVPSNNTSNITSTLEHLSLNNNHGQWSFENGKGRCNVCEIELTSLQHKNEHLAGQKHSKKTGQWSNQLTSQSDFCRTPTGKGIPSIERSSTTQSTFQDLQRNQSFCEICSLALTSPEHAGQHYAGKNHNKRVEQEKIKNGTNCQIGNKEIIGVSVVSPENGKNPAGALNKPYDLDDKGRGYCNVCGVGLTSKQNADDHLKGRNHKKKLETWDPSKPM
ncbi:unnamed protein product [Lymnaea stagnalis]|uniref:U1-type domain-containing protein n=1 Tax=Lymnaea stagnalis TaxID=6523 RepID=A0AAV2IMR0_LYMST